MTDKIVTRRLSLDELQALASGETPSLRSPRNAKPVENVPPPMSAGEAFRYIGKIAEGELDYGLVMDSEPARINVPTFDKNNSEPTRENPTAHSMMGLGDSPSSIHPKEMDVNTYRPRTPKVNKKPSFVKSDYPQERETINSGTLYERWDPPSRCLFYNFSDIMVRKLNIDDLVLLNRAMQRSDTTLLLDALGATITEDIRVLTVPDFRHLMFWHRLNSYIKSPYSVIWTSKYRNENETQVSRSTLEERQLEMTSEQVKTWEEKGFTVPRCRDMEIVDTSNIDGDTSFLFQRAQWISLNGLEDRIDELKAAKNPIPTITARIEALRSKGLEGLEDIRDFVAAVGTYGVTEKIKVTDAHFDPKIWLSNLKKELTVLEETLTVAVESRKELAPAIDLIRSEVSLLENRINSGEVITAEEEEVTLSFSVWSLFPNI